MKKPSALALAIGFFVLLPFCQALAADAPADQLPAQEQEQAMEGSPLFKGTKAQPGPITVTLGKQGSVNVPEGYFFYNSKDTQTILERMENLINGTELGMISPEDFSWIIIFEFKDVGYVKDTGEDADIDADEILDSFRKGVAAANKEKQSRGWSTTELIGWSTPPHYNRATQNLEWGLQFRSSDSGNLFDNYNVRLLGREGVMEVILVGDAASYTEAMAETREILKGFSFTEGKTYAEFRQGDKLAGYGLAALVAGGTLAAAAKTGLLTKFFKPILAGVAALGALVLNLFRRKKK